MAESTLHTLAQLGQSVWVDNLSRDLVQTGQLARMITEDAVSGVTSNPTIFQKALADGQAYDAQLRQVLQSTSDPKEIFVALASTDVRDACQVLMPVWESTSGGDGYVSMEVDPRFAFDAEATQQEALRLSDEIAMPNLLIKIPATLPGLGAVEEMIARGVSINVTLIFSIERYVAVTEAYIRGLERLIAAGGDPTRVHSVASFFISRVDSETDKRLDEIGGHDDLRGRLGVANGRLAYEQYQRIFAGPRWQALADRGARTQRCLWASTSTKNPEYPDTMYVDELVGPQTVNTMPEDTIAAAQDHGRPRANSVMEDVDGAHALIGQLAEVGIAYEDVVEVLEQEGVQKFEASFMELIAGIEKARDAVLA